MLNGINTKHGLYKIRKSNIEGILIGQLFDWESLVEAIEKKGYKTHTYPDQLYAYDIKGNCLIVADKQRSHKTIAFYPEKKSENNYAAVLFDAGKIRTQEIHLITFPDYPSCKAYCNGLNDFIGVTKEDAVQVLARIAHAQMNKFSTTKSRNK